MSVFRVIEQLNPRAGAGSAEVSSSCTIRRMGWSYPVISLQDLMKLIGNFVDMVILASGYQSTGRLAHWDTHNIKKSFQWANFLENVAKGLTSSGDYQDSVKELNAALIELTSNPHFPQMFFTWFKQGLAHLSCTTLCRAREFLLERLIHTLPLRESHLKAIMTASVEMDFSKLQRIDNDFVDVYLEQLRRIPSKGLHLSERRNFMEGSKVSSPSAVPSGKQDNVVDCDFSVSAIQQLGRRQLAVSCCSALETGLENMWRTIGQSMHAELGSISNSELIEHSACSIAEELPVEAIVWNRWRSRSLSYMLDNRTIRLVSGASLIFAAPEGQWTKIFGQLNILSDSDDLCETIELLLLGCIADRWSPLIEHLMSVSYESVTLSRLYHEVFNLSLGKSLHLFLKGALLIASQLKRLWELPPVLAAVAIPSWSQLFRSYLGELEGQVRGNSLATRRCSCIAGAMEHREWVKLREIKRERREASELRRVSDIIMLELLLHQLFGKPAEPGVGSAFAEKALWLWFHDIQMLKRGKAFLPRGSTSTATLVNSVQRETTETCRHGSYAAWLLLWRFRSQWKRLLSKQSNKTRYNYDAQSYSRNFDNGCSDDNPHHWLPEHLLEYILLNIYVVLYEAFPE
ncbi:UNVERIFIED_CONTAM: hypothetical protein Sradi_0263300 [Sesamum radiatum]|uniref:Uncharacterized protein n=1 Tax=Sesamum radiatum TaxID=300843 RepID=A0AAW2W2U7_SESRA